MKILIAVATCHRYRDRADACRETWAKDVQDADVKLFLGSKPGYIPLTDEVALDVPDDHKNFTQKVNALWRWTLARGYDYLWKVDDDTYVRPERLLPLSGADCVGDIKQSLFGPHPGGYCYGLSRAAISTLVRYDPGPASFANQEDRFAGAILQSAGYEARHTELIVEHKSFHLSGFSQGPAPSPANRIAAACEFLPSEMRSLHAAFLRRR